MDLDAARDQAKTLADESLRKCMAAVRQIGGDLQITKDCIRELKESLPHYIPLATARDDPFGALMWQYLLGAKSSADNIGKRLSDVCEAVRSAQQSIATMGLQGIPPCRLICKHTSFNAWSYRG